MEVNADLVIRKLERYIANLVRENAILVVQVEQLQKENAELTNKLEEQLKKDNS
jgi:cell division protein FtsB